MATHSQNIEALRTAVYGEQVRGAMIELFDEDYSMVKKGIGIGTEITSSSSSVAGYVDGNIYINSETLDIWKTDGSVWSKAGNLKGIASIDVVETDVDGAANVVTITRTDGTEATFNVRNGNTGNGIASISDPTVSGNVKTYTINFTNGTTKTFTVTDGKSIVGISKTGTIGLVDTYTITFNDNSTAQFTVTNGNGVTGVEWLNPTGTSIIKRYRMHFSDGTYFDYEVTDGTGSSWDELGAKPFEDVDFYDETNNPNGSFDFRMNSQDKKELILSDVVQDKLDCVSYDDLWEPGTYTEGKYVIENNVLYRARINTSSEPETDYDEIDATTYTHSWIKTSPQREFISLKNTLSQLYSNLTNRYGVKYYDYTASNVTINTKAYTAVAYTIPSVTASNVLGAKIISATGATVDGNMGVVASANNFVLIYNNFGSNRTYTSITIRLFYIEAFN